MLNLSNLTPLSKMDERDSSISTMKTQTESITTISEDEIIREAGYDPETKEKMQELIEYLSEEFQGGKKKENVEGMPKIGDIIDTFTIRGTIGHGGTGTVFVAERKGLLYAIKCATKSKDLEHEFGIAKKCRSKPRLLKCCKYGETDKINYMVMELADLSFHDFWRESVNVDDINAEERIKKACFYLSKGLQALEELHSLNLMHHDVKPNNFVMDIKNPDELILIDYSAAAKVENGICVENGYCGSTIFGARDALADRHRYWYWCVTQDPKKQLQQHFKSDIESWFYCLILMANKEAFMTFIADDMENMLEAKREIWSNRVIKHEFLSGMPTQFSSIMYMIDLIQPGEPVNNRGIYDLLQQVVDGDYILIDGSLELFCTQCPSETPPIQETPTTSADVAEPTMIRGKIQWPGGSSMKQNFSLPSSIIYYLAMNPENPEVYNKLIQTCKYFFEVNPILVSDLMFEPYDYLIRGKTRIFPINSEPGKSCIEIDLNKLSSKIWLTNRLSIQENYTPNFFSLLRQRLYRCNVSELYLYNVTISFDDYEFLVQTVKKLELFWRVKVLDEDGKILKLDKILEVCPQIEHFYRDFQKDDFSMLAASTLENIAKLQNLSKLKYFLMEMIPEVFAFQDISDFVIKHFSGATVKLKFGPLTSAAFNAEIDALCEKIRQSNIKNHTIDYRR